MVVSLDLLAMPFGGLFIFKHIHPTDTTPPVSQVGRMKFTRPLYRELCPGVLNT